MGITSEGGSHGPATREEIILAVDDNPGVRAAVVLQLRVLGYGVREADSAGSALAIIDGDDRIDLLFTDIVMPGIGGKELALRARLKRPGLKVLFTSGFPDASMTSGNGLDRGDVLLSKPYRHRDLAAAVHKVLRSPS